MNSNNMIISIGRECGSGGLEIGQKLADHYNIKLYDRNILDILAANTNEDPEKLAQIEERVSGHLLSFVKNGFSSDEHMMMSKLSKSDQLFLREKALIEHLAETESFVIVGRAANAIIPDAPNVLKLYIYASEKFKIPRVKDYYNLDSDKEALKTMGQVDKLRKEYFEYYSKMKWGSSDGHDFMINSAVLGIDKTTDLIIQLADLKKNTNA